MYKARIWNVDYPGHDEEDGESGDGFSCGCGWLDGKGRDWRDVEVRIIGVRSGPKPRDWKILWNEPSDQFVGEFWRGVEQGVGS